ncbi:hypothetical protein [Micromonospora okii]|uniref:hypothetical protein n=1 Tax=Micromonospora okii TaxID=1182970 RepID=UPI001E30D38D|nr:hypothetical protein [Micromonospora okii]
MNAKNIAGHAAGAALFTATWETAIHLPPGDPGTALEAAGLLPWLIAALSLALIERGERLDARPQPAPVPVQARPVPARPRELTR